MRHVLIYIAAILSVYTLAHAQFSGGGSAAKPKLSSEELQKLCDSGNAIACDDLGVRYLAGDSVPKDVKKSAALFLRACDGGDPVGCYDRAESHFYGDGVAKDMAQAAAFYLRACDGGHAKGCAQLAMHYANGEGVTQDDAKTALYSDRSCKAGSPLGCTLLGAVYREGAPGYPKDEKRAAELFTDACFSKVDFSKAPDEISTAACGALAKMTGKAACQVMSDKDNAGNAATTCFDAQLGWKTSAVDVPKSATDSVAVANTAVYAGNAAYESKDFAKAAGHYASACDNGSVAACGKLGEMYVDGQGVARNGARAAPLLAKACDGALPSSCAKLGQLYDKGDGVQPNKTRAFTLFDGACSKADMASCYGLGRLYESGQGTTANVAQAATLYQKACTAGIADGCASIGTMYVNGVHFAQSDVQAMAYFNLACSKGRQNSCEQSKNIETAISRQNELKVAKAAASLPARATYSANCAKANTFGDTNLAEAERYARMGIQLNDPYCIHMLGWVNEKKGDYELAFAYYTNAANKNVRNSIHNIGGLYYAGQFVDRNYNTAIAWYKRALLIGQTQGDAEFVASTKSNIANAEAAMRPPPVRERVCRDVGSNPGGADSPLVWDRVCD